MNPESYFILIQYTVPYFTDIDYNDWLQIISQHGLVTGSKVTQILLNKIFG